MKLTFIRTACLLISLLLFWKAYVYSPFHEKFPFGSYMGLALASAGALSLWGVFRIHKPGERRAIIAGACLGLIVYWLSRAGGILFEIIFGTGNLSPMIGIFVVGPLGFIIGMIGGVAGTFLWQRKKNSGKN